MFLYMNYEHEEKSKSDLQISSSSNESRPGTRFEMCSRTNSMEDSSMIKSDCLKSGIMDKRNFNNGIWSIWAWGLLIGKILLDGSVLRGTFQQSVSWERSAGALGKLHFGDTLRSGSYVSICLRRNLVPDEDTNRSPKGREVRDFI